MNQINYFLESLNNIIDKKSRTYHHNIWLISKEYFKIGDYKNSLYYSSQALEFYKNEGWLVLIRSINNLALQAAYYCGNVNEFIKIGLESIGDWNTLLKDEEKILIQDSITNLFNSQMPLDLSFLCDSKKQQDDALILFNEFLMNNNTNQNFTLKMSEKISSFIDVKLFFDKEKVYANESIKLIVCLYLKSPKKILFNNLKVLFSKVYYNQFCIKNLSDEYLIEKKIYKFEFNFKPNPQDANQELKVEKLIINLGINNFSIDCEWLFRNDYLDINFIDYFVIPSSNKINDNELFSKFMKNQKKIFIEFKKPLVNFELESNDVVLFDENFPIKLTIENNEGDEIRNLDLYIRQYKDQNDYEELLNEFFSIDCDVQVFNKTKFIKISLSKCLKKDSKLEKIIYMRSKTNSNLLLDLSISYFVKVLDQPNEKNVLYYTCTSKKTINLTTNFPFENIFSIQNLLKKKDNYWPKALEPFYLKMKFIANSNLQIENIDFLLNTNSFVLEEYNSLVDYNEKSNLKGKYFKAEEELVELIKLYSKHESNIDIKLGVLLIKWRKADKDLYSNPLNETRILLPEFSIKPSLIFIESHFPNFGYIKTRFDVDFKIINRTDNFLPLLFSIDDNINFMYSGNKQKKIYIEPKNFWVETVSFFPMFCGYLELPKIRLVAYPNTINAMPLDETIEEILPSILKIIPKN